MKIWYKQPATRYLEGLPIGNGKMASMDDGGVEVQTMTMNEDSLWYGGFKNRVNPDTKEYFSKIRQLVFEGKIWEAEKLAFLTMTATHESERTYQLFANLEFKHYYNQKDLGAVSFLSDEFVQAPQSVVATDYSRTLELDKSIATTKFNVNGVNYTRESFASFPNQIIAMKFTADKKASISFSALLNRAHFRDYWGRKDDHIIMLGGKTGGDGVEYYCAANVVTKGGTVRTLGQNLVVENADEAIVYFYATTSFYTDDVLNNVVKQVEKFTFEQYEDIKAEHIKDFSTIFNRVDFDLTEDKFDDIPTNERLDNIKADKKDLGMQVILYQYGRYLQIASSREGSLPMNLRGSWNHEFKPAWDSKFTININQEMLYWPTDMTNMSECGEPMYHLIERMNENGQKVAKDMYGYEGFVAHHNTDLWADCAPQDIHRAAFWALGGAWVVMHLWDSYDYNRDVKFLEKYYPIIENAVKFVLDYLVESPEGYLVTCPTHSPENGYYLPTRKDIKPALTYGATMDNMIINHLFNITKEASEILGIDNETVAKMKEAHKKLAPVKISKSGRIMEWHDDFEEPEPGHRHMAHMFALHPADEISIFKTPDLAQACMNSIDKRLAHQKPEDGKNGWTLTWMMLFEGRLCRAEKAYEYITNMFKHAVAPNLFGLCVTDEIYVLDGNLGMTAAMTELILQSQAKELFFPALPKAWKTGHLNGIKARGGFEVSVNWDNNIIQEAKITSIAGQNCHLRTVKEVKVYEVSGNDLIDVSVEKVDNINGTFCVSFPTETGKTYIVK